MKIVSFLIAFVIFSIVILFHELGHFLLAKANGIRVNEFCFGISVWRSLHDGRGRRRFDGQSCIW